MRRKNDHRPKSEITLGELVTEEKSNEITAILALLDLLDVSGDIVTIDAMGCQRKIADKILSKKADYVLAVKDNQAAMYEAIRDHFDWLDKEHLPPDTCEHWVDKPKQDHGRTEQREVVTAPGEWLAVDADWPGIRTIIRYRCTRIYADGESSYDRYYISSFDTDAEGFGYLIRNHWSIENRLHWMLDVVFREDAARARKDNSPLNMNVLRKAALARLKMTATNKKLSVRRKSLKAALDINFLHRILLDG
ncbi:MAG: ISAs1 family transposase [Oscillospiraceae bacterium]|nr:ISAs1 family transposase [Oscillospiraceae bacterium]